jgi:hypothetical protein
MAAISQKTVGKLDALLESLIWFPTGERTIPLWTWGGLRSALYESGFDVHVLDYLWQEYRGMPSRFLPLIHDGTIPAYVSRSDGSDQPVPSDADKAIGQIWLASMIQVAISKAESLPDLVSADELIESLKEDGFDFLGGKVVPAAMKAVDLKQEDEYLITLIRTIGPSNMEEIRRHHDESDKAFTNTTWGAASSEARNFFIAVLRGLRDVATARGGIPAFDQSRKDGPLIDNFQTIGLFTSEEQNAVKAVWVLLCYSGPHVGVKEADSARLSRLLAIGMTEWVALKFIAWEKNGFKPF